MHLSMHIILNIIFSYLFYSYSPSLPPSKAAHLPWLPHQQEGEDPLPLAMTRASSFTGEFRLVVPFIPEVLSGADRPQLAGVQVPHDGGADGVRSATAWRPAGVLLCSGERG